MAFQETVHNIDSGTTAKFLKRGMIAVILIGITLLYYMVQFRGLATEAGMDQAQIARSLVSGEGFSTRYIRPLAIRVLSDAGKPTDSPRFPEFSNSPLNPLLEALALLPVKGRLTMSPTETIGTGDRAIAILGILLLFAGVGVWYFVATMLFDRTLALFSTALLLVTDLLWQYALSGLPQLLLILLFGLATLCAVKAKQIEDETGLLSLPLIIAAAFFFGLMSLTHGVTSFLIPGYLTFILLGFQGRTVAFLTTLGVYLATVSPWLIHNLIVCHNAFGLTSYVALAGAGISESEVMRGVNTGLALGGGVATKFKNSLLEQGNHLWQFLGLNLAALFFIPSLLHGFRNPVASFWRWMVLLMWIGACVGMVFFCVDKDAVSACQLHIVFLPIFAIYGTAFFLVLLNRLDLSMPALRFLFLSAILVVSGAPMILTLLSGQQARIQWPPYVPPFIAVLGNWFQPKEVLCSDMPWAVAWYANRKCILLPETIHAFNEISDYGALGTPIVGLYLTPLSGRQDFVDLVKGPYKDWGPVIMRTVNMDNFLLKSFTPLPIDGECILFADSERWARRTSR